MAFLFIYIHIRRLHIFLDKEMFTSIVRNLVQESVATSIDSSGGKCSARRHEQTGTRSEDKTS